MALGMLAALGKLAALGTLAALGMLTALSICLQRLACRASSADHCYQSLQTEGLQCPCTGG